MPRFVFNTRTEVVHNADCPETATPNQNGRDLPWPRYGHLATQFCEFCLPAGRPVIPRGTAFLRDVSRETSGQ